MQFDIVIKGGRLVDGSGLRSYVADLAISGDRIARIGRIDAPADRIIDATGKWVTPGFIDVHTHYDVQLDWDPIASPSMQHGVTTVLTGNWGFTLYPAKPEDVDWLAGMLTRVEGMSREAMAEGFKWSGGDFAQYWARREGKGVYLNHDASRTTNDCYVCEIAPGKKLAPQRMLFEEMIMILSGRGSTSVWND